MKAAPTGPELPSELVLLIGQNIENVRDLNAFVRTSQRAYHLLNHRLYQLAATTLGTLERSCNQRHLVMRGVEWTSRMSKTRATVFEWLIVHRMYASLALLFEHGAVDFDTRIKTVFEPPPPAEPDYYPPAPTLLMVAAGWNEEGICRMLLSKGACVNAEDDGKTALHIACSREYGSEELIRLLIDHGADVEAQDKFGDTPLHTAIPWSSPEIIKMLVEHGGASLEVRNAVGYTPLMLAADKGRLAVLRMLVGWGADVNAKSGQRALDIFRRLGSRHFLKPAEYDEAIAILTPNPGWK